MSETVGQMTGRLEEIRLELERITDALRSEETDDATAATLASEAAALTAEAAREAGSAIEQLNRG